ncbi:hypothetical protein AN401_07230 [Zobellella denitrificans]|uniref:Head decoration protein n=1 Tax=Zobellella denitrificans TaxID=347534 RepID=A0A291HNF7_9GAMM|nr:hypothetical protein [Zobellella denitrificans]ATG73675.1 hypothetical protein AN401_07230 [Zobellella denitrificans]
MATTKPRNTARRAGVFRAYEVAANAVINAGAIVVLNASDYADKATTATGLVALGIARSSVDNTGGANGDLVIEVERGYFHLGNSAAADEITLGDIGKPCYLVDDETVALTHATNTRSLAGYVDDVDANGVWVRIDPTSGINA